jgi:murein DD-endopeptidase MepM/ murein hydrolase activator NlpD
MLFSRIRLRFFIGLAGVLLVAHRSTSQVPSRLKTPTSYLETERVAPDAFDLPMHIPPALSGGFAELRINHLHSGIDFKTQKTEGIPIFAPADGWVSRIRISSFGFGYALYLNHSNGFTTVYGHLQGYAEPIASIAKQWQYQLESFELDTLLPQQRIPVRRGQLIAYSGSSGLSAAPHLHFEIRDTPSEETVDPLLWYSDRMADSTPPRIFKLALYAFEGEGVLRSGAQKILVPVSKNKNGEWVLNARLPEVWGKIGFGLNAYDYMDSSSNQYGICSIRLFLDEELIFQQDLSRFNFNHTRYVNALVDYESWQRNRTWIMKSFVDPGNHLNVYPALKDWGYVRVNTQRTYRLRYELMDRAGNSTVFRFVVQGQRQPIPKKVFTGKKMIFWVPNTFSKNDFQLEIPAGSLYQTLDFQYKQIPDVGFSDLFVVHSSYTPIHEPIHARFRIIRDVLPEKKHYYLAKENSQSRFLRVEGVYKDGWMDADIREFGRYKILSDTVMPKITAPNLENIVKNNVIRIRIVDDASGVTSWRGTIDGKWMLFALDGKSGWLSCTLEPDKLVSGREHRLMLIVKDACGNENKQEMPFFW